MEDSAIPPPIEDGEASPIYFMNQKYIIKKNFIN